MIMRNAPAPTQPPSWFLADCSHTAYGAKVKVPGNVDVLVAGTSCVDYSGLNRNKKTIQAKGESGRTFHGMLRWVDKHRPPIVILENICNCPWDTVVGYFREKGYSASWSRFDTKNYYIPHTRTRVYGFAIDLKNSNIPAEWKSLVGALARPSSSPLEAFLLPVDDPRIHQSRQNLARESERRTGRVDWGKCESRHQRVRLEEELGLKRPFTQWKEDGSCLLPDFAWADWATGQVDRVLDLLEISLLKSAQKGIDQNYKT
jgi:site-specific DNA-cytosine methylase